MRWLCLTICLGLTWSLSGRPGVLRTVDGRTVEGDIRLTNGFLIVTTTNDSAITVPPTNLLTATFETAGNPAQSAAVGQGNGLLGYYYGNTNLEGNVIVRLDETVDFDWGTGEAIIGLGPDHFGVAWVGEVEAPVTGDFTFSVVADDAGRLVVADKLVLDNWGRREPGAIASEPIAMEAGKRVPLRFSYYDSIGNARAHLFWSGPGIARSIIPRNCLYATNSLPEHRSNITTNRGLLATYFSEPEHGGRTLTRVDTTVDFEWAGRDPAPGFARTNFSARWSGQVKADYAEEYTFYTLTDERVRLWIDDRLLIDRPDQTWLSENKESLPLAASERYNIRLETRSRNEGAVARLLWSSASTPKAVVPATHLYPSRPTPRRNRVQDALEKIPPGVFLRSGAFIAGTVERASETSVRMTSLFWKTPISTVNVARILCQPLSPSMAARLVPGRIGVLLTKGDFVDGEFRGLENDQVKVSSILLGMRTYLAKKEVLAVALREVNSLPAAYEVELFDQSRMSVGSIAFERDVLILQEAMLGSVRVPADEVASIKRRSAGSRAK